MSYNEIDIDLKFVAELLKNEYPSISNDKIKKIFNRLDIELIHSEAKSGLDNGMEGIFHETTVLILEQASEILSKLNSSVKTNTKKTSLKKC